MEFSCHSLMRWHLSTFHKLSCTILVNSDASEEFSNCLDVLSIVTDVVDIFI